MEELIYVYPSVTWNDFFIYKEELNEKINLYHANMEGYIFYETLDDAIDYLEEIKNEYYDWLKTNGEINSKTSFDDECADVVYRTYDIKVYKDKHDVMLLISTPPLYCLIDVYRWLDGVIAQLKTIEI